ncbi:MAG: phosphatidate cytidylyltransferase [Clostridia bacterium]|nr:phosphatidate cytidylyltransferase [Clostridia bacterium]
MVKRVITAVFFTAVILLGVFLQGIPMRILTLFAMVVGMYETYRALESKGLHPITWVGYLFCVVTAVLQYLKGSGTLPALEAVSVPMMSVTFAVTLGISVVILRGHVDFERLESTVFPIIYPGLFFTLMIAMQDVGSRYVALIALVLMFLAASINDVFALVVGLSIGRHRLSPEISPKKSIEGSIGGLIACILFAMAIPPVVGYVGTIIPAFAADTHLPPIWAFGLLGLFAGALSQIGDLAASLLKRHCGIKDFGTMFPGHGGMMDRMDGILFCTVAVALFFEFFVH